jgi:glycosyltransferase involved in cell wall biosynthesis
VSLRILYDHQVFSLQNAGGVSRYYFELMRCLACVPDVHQELFLGLHQSEMPFPALAGENVRVVGRNSSLGPGGRRYMVNEALGNAYAITRGKFDIYHPTHHRCMPLVRAERMVVTHCDCTHEKFPAEFRYLDRVLRAKRALFARADAIICISEASRQDLLRFYNVDPTKTRVIHLGFTRLDRSPQAAVEIRRHVRRDYLLYVGSRAIYKNFRGLLKAFHDTRLHESLDILVLGGLPFSGQESALVAELGLTHAVAVIPKFTDALLAEAYAGARLLAYPSLSEGFGLSPLEAMSLGCPVLACHASSIPEVCGDAPFYFDPEEPESMQQALLQAVEDDEARKRAIARGHEVVARYSWEKCARETLAVYRECI